MNGQFITIGELVVLMVGSVVIYAFIKTVIETIKTK